MPRFLFFFWLAAVFLPFFAEAGLFSVQRPSQDEVVETIIRVSDKTGIRPVLLYGLLGQETGFGGNLGKTESSWNAFCGSRSYLSDCRSWSSYDCKGNYINAGHYDEILKNLGYTDSSGNADRSQIPTSSTCALGFTQFEPNTWWVVLRNRGEPLLRYNPWRLEDALSMTAYHLDELGADGSEVATGGRAIGPGDRQALQKYYCGGIYFRNPECVSYARSIERIAESSPEPLFVKGLQNQLELLERQRVLRRRRIIQQQIQELEEAKRAQEEALPPSSELPEPEEPPFQEQPPLSAQEQLGQPVILTTHLPKGAVGVPYRATLMARGGFLSYKGKHIWQNDSQLPEGLILDQKSGVISGTPTSPTAGLEVAIRAFDNRAISSTKTFIIVIEKKALAIDTRELPAGTEEIPYKTTLSAKGGFPPYRWSVAGVLPEGLSLDATTGIISGTPVPGIADRRVEVKVVDGEGVSAVKTFSIVIKQKPLAVTTAALPLGEAGLFYSATLFAEGGKTPYGWSIVSGELPQGLSLDPFAGKIFGIPANATFSNLTVAVTDSSGLISEKLLNLKVRDQLIITPERIPRGSVGVFYAATLSVSGGTPPYTWSISAGELPSGFNLDPLSGAIAGNTQIKTSANFTVEVRDSTGLSGRKRLSIEIKDPLVITTSELPGGKTDTAYNAALSASGGSPPYRWGISFGVMPSGLSLDSSGVISGLPRAQSVSTILLLVTDSDDVSERKQFTIEISVPPPPLAIPPPPPPPTPIPPPSSTSTITATTTKIWAPYFIASPIELLREIFDMIRR